MKNLYLRCSVGIDVGKKELFVYVKTQNSNLKEQDQKGRKFINNKSDRKRLIKYISKFIKQSEFHVIVMEATGAYYENIAYEMAEKEFDICVVLPTQSAYFSKGINQKSKNDEKDSKMLAQMGLEKFNSLTRWNPPSFQMKKLRSLVRYRFQLVRSKTAAITQLKGLKDSFEPEEFVLEQKIRDIDYITNQIIVIEKKMKESVKGDPEIEERINNVCTIKGVSFITATSIVGETFGFERFTSIPQLISYSGYDVVENQSGSRIGKKKISKKGNSRIRRALHFPALTSVKYCPKMKTFYSRIYKNNPKIKMIGYVAVQRKLLVLIYTLYKKNVPYDENYLHNNEEKKSGKVINTLP